MQDHIIICGLGNIGFSTFQLLVLCKLPIIVISDKTSDELKCQVEKLGCKCIVGDARDESLLIKAGIKNATAILALTDQDSVNVSIVIHAKALNANIKIILRIFDTELGEYISGAFGVHQSISTSNLAVSNCTQLIANNHFIEEIFIKNVPFIIQKKNINILDNEGGKILAVDHLVNPTEAIVIKQQLPAHSKVSKLFHIINVINYLRSPLFSNLRRFVLVIGIVIFLSSIYLHLQMGLNFIDALYFVTTTVTTVGYGDINFYHSSAQLKLFGCALMLFGGAALALLFSSITEIMLRTRLSTVLGGKLVPKKDHIILVGSGHLAYRIALSIIKNNIPLVLIESEDKMHQPVDIKRYVSIVVGEARNADTLLRANIKTAKAIIILTDSDIENLGISLASKKLNSTIQDVVHITNNELRKKIKSALAWKNILSISEISSPYFTAAILGKNIKFACVWKNQLIFIASALEDFIQRSNKISCKNISDGFNVYTMNLDARI